MEERFWAGLAGTVVFCLIIGVFMYSKFSRERAILQQQVAHTRDVLEQEANKQTRALLCGKVNEQCEVVVHERLSSCDKKSIAKLVETAIPQPIKIAPCEGIEDRLIKSCPHECEFEPASLLVFAGKTTVEDKRKNENGCEIELRRPVTVSGNCIMRPISSAAASVTPTT